MKPYYSEARVFSLALPPMSPGKQPSNKAKGKGRIESPMNLVKCLLDWFKSNARDLPWRRTTDPYAVWVSEIMLQQTQVAKVIPYWRRWMKAFPSIRHLADADIQDVLFQWQGLGYYSRARNLHKAAGLIARELDGQFPESPDTMETLPGIGDYTRGAISSIAFDLPLPAVDGNVIRVLSRIRKITDNVGLSPTKQLIRNEALALVMAADRMRSETHPRACSSLNQSLMELGATVCTPTSPSCHSCPVRPHCLAFRAGIQESLPLKTVTRKRIRHYHTIWIVSHRNKCLVTRHGEGDWNAGLHHFPYTVDQESWLKSENLAGLAPIPVDRETITHIGDFTHTITHNFFNCRVVSASAVKNADWRRHPENFMWIHPRDSRNLAWSGAHLKVLNLLGW